MKRKLLEGVIRREVVHEVDLLSHIETIPESYQNSQESFTEPFFLGTAPSARPDFVKAFIAVVLLIVAFLVTAPMASIELKAYPAFVPIYDFAVCILDLTTAFLLFAQYRQLRERSFLVLTCGYLFTPVLLIAHSLSFPDAFGHGSLIGGEQTSAWLWIVWHSLFPFFIGGYAFFRKWEISTSNSKIRVKSFFPTAAILGTLFIALAIIVITTIEKNALPKIMVNNAYHSHITNYLLSMGWIIHLVVLYVLIMKTNLSRLIDVWLAVSVIALLSDMALSAIMINGRYEVGFYFGRIYGLLGAAFIVSVLLRETMFLYENIVKSSEKLRISEALVRTELGSRIIAEENLRELNASLEETIRLRTSEIRESNHLLTSVMDVSMASILALKSVRNAENKIIDFIFILINNTGIKRAGNKNLIGKSFLKMYPGILENNIFGRYVDVVENGITQDFEVLFNQRGYNNWFRIIAIKLEDGLVVSSEDITERKKAEQDLLKLKDELARRATDKYLTLLNSIDEGFVIIKMIYDEQDQPIDYEYLEINQVYEMQTGLRNVIGKPVSEVIPDLEESWIKIYGEVAKSGIPVRFENRSGPLTNGTWYEVYACPTGNPADHQVAVLFKDITDRVRLERKRNYLLKLSDLLRPLADTSEIKLMVSKLLGEQLNVSRAYYVDVEEDGNHINIDVDYSKGFPSLVGRYNFDNFAPAFKDEFLQGKNIIINNSQDDPIIPEIFRSNWKSYFSLAYAGIPLVKEGKLVALLSVINAHVHNWTAHEIEILEETAERTWAAVERARAEETIAGDLRARTAELLEQSHINDGLRRINELMDTFVYAAAHDLKGPISNLRLVTEVISQTEDVKTKLILQEKYPVIIEALDQTITGLINVLAIEKDSSLTIREVNFHDVFDDVLGEMHEKAREPDSTITYDFLGCHHIRYVESYISSIFRNMMTNAIKYRSENRKLKFIVRSEISGEYVLLTFQDNGIGIDLDTYEKDLFKPFKRFTIQSGGSGLGLHLIKSMVTKNGGKIEVQSKTGSGTIFKVFLVPYNA